MVESLCINPKNGGALIFDVEDLNIPLADILSVNIAKGTMDPKVEFCFGITKSASNCRQHVSHHVHQEQ